MTTTACFTLASSHAHAQNIPNSADIAHIRSPLEQRATPQQSSNFTPENTPSTINAPAGSENITITIESLEINGLSAYTNKELEEIYHQYLHSQQPLSTLWVIADAITKRYQKDGYFLSKAFVPNQEADNNHYTISVVEGFIADVALDQKLQNSTIIAKVKDDIKSKKPIRISDIEQAILQINDASPFKSQATLSAIQDAPLGGVGLAIHTADTATGNGTFLVNNHGSRYVGPYQNTIIYSDNFYKDIKSQIAIQSTTPWKESKYLAMQHSIPLTPDDSVKIAASYVRSAPGYTLAPRQLRSQAYDVKASLQHNLVRGAFKSLFADTGFTHKTVDTNILEDSDLNHDSIYKLHASLQGNYTDNYGGTSAASVTISRGLKIFSANHKESLNSSRLGAQPEFTKFEIDATHSHSLNNDLSLDVHVLAQYSPDTLFASEEFSYGGYDMGRAFDSAEFSGQRGAAGSVTLNYYGMANINEQFSPVPFIFYDAGLVLAPQQDTKHITASSAGFGTNFTIYKKLNSTLSVAWPLGEDRSAMSYGSNRSPRGLIQFSYNFN